MNPSTLTKKLFMRFIVSDTRRQMTHLKGRLTRRKIPTVHYFHQVDDPHSHLAIQKINALRDHYKVRFEFHLAQAPTEIEQGDSQRFPSWALRDARAVASEYGVKLPHGVDQIEGGQVQCAESYLAEHLTKSCFVNEAISVGQRLWSGEPINKNWLSNAAINGSALRSKLGHWLSATFYFEGEWYWGVDRLLHLENRLKTLNLSNNQCEICVPRPKPESIGSKDASRVTLEFFPSLRSPYSAICFDRTVNLAKRTGVNFRLRPVMPMMMRGVPAQLKKQLYILTDAKREAEHYGERFGCIVDPIGKPVKKAFALLPLMIEKNLSTEFCSNYLRAAWREGIDITNNRGLKKVVERTGANWNEAQEQLENESWEVLLEDNVSDMLAAGLWGVPSFKVTGGTIDETFCCWGQDRLWRVESEISRRSF